MTNRMNDTVKWAPLKDTNQWLTSQTGAHTGRITGVVSSPVVQASNALSRPLYIGLWMEASS